MFRKKAKPDEQAPLAAGASAAEQDRTDPLGALAGYTEQASLLSEGHGTRLEYVAVLNGSAAAKHYLRLSVPEDVERAGLLRRMLLELPERTTGFEDLLALPELELAAALMQPPATMADYLAPQAKQPAPALRVIDLLDGLRELCQLLLVARQEYGLGWGAPAAAGVGLTAENAGGPPGYLRWRCTFLGWDALAHDAAEEAPALLALFGEALARLAQTAEEQGLAFCASQARRAAVWLAERGQLAKLDCAALATALAQLRFDYITIAATDTGRRREHNEDAYLTMQLDQLSAAGARFTLAAVADGMGGHLSGEVASSLTLDMLRQQLLLAMLPPRTRPADPRLLPEQLAAAIPAIGRALSERAQLDVGLSGMGTTLCGLALLETQSTLPELAADAAAGYIFSVGDSRAYLTSAAGLSLLTHDHSYVQQLVDSGSISEEEAFDHPNKNVVTHCLGGGGGDSTPDIYSLELGPGDLVLLCSDGLSDALRDRELWQMFCSQGAVQAPPDELAPLALALIAAANLAGGPDNITVILLGCTL